MTKKTKSLPTKTILKLEGKTFSIVEGIEHLDPKRQQRHKWLNRLFRYTVCPFELCQFAFDFYSLDYIGMAEWGVIGAITLFFYAKGQEDKVPFIKLDEEKFSYQFDLLERRKQFYFSDLKSVHFELETIVFYRKNGTHQSFVLSTLAYKEKLELIRVCLVEQLKKNKVKITISDKNKNSFYQKYPELEGQVEIFNRYRKV